jgi:hypothetical protein
MRVNSRGAGIPNAIWTAFISVCKEFGKVESVKKKKLGLKFWAAVAVSAIGMGVVIAFVAGFLLGHFTGHHHTTTAAPSGQSMETSVESSEEGESEKVTTADGIAPTPRFTSDELIEAAGDNWITKGGGTTNARYSAVGEITRTMSPNSKVISSPQSA